MADPAPRQPVPPAKATAQPKRTAAPLKVPVPKAATSLEVVPAVRPGKAAKRTEPPRAANAKATTPAAPAVAAKSKNKNAAPRQTPRSLPTDSPAVAPKSKKTASGKAAAPAARASSNAPKTGPDAAPKKTAAKAKTIPAKTAETKVPKSAARKAANTNDKPAKTKSAKAKTPLVLFQLPATGKGKSPAAASKSKNGSVTATADDAPRKAKRARVPSDLAEQYGERVKTRQAPTKAAERKARRDAAAREKLRQIMTPSDDLIARLARMGAIATATTGFEDDGTEEAVQPVKTVTVRRPRKWEARCGRCGVAGIFVASAGLCTKCGAITIRD